MVKETLVLRAALTDRPARWRRVVFLPFGPRANQLGLVTNPHRTSIPELPTSFAIAPDGSIWIVDVVKKRLAHFDRRGRLLGAVGGFRLDRFHPHLRDAVFSDGRLYEMEEGPGLLSVVGVVGADGTVSRTEVRHRGTRMTTLYLFPVPGSIGALVLGQASLDRPGQGPNGFARLDLTPPGRVELLPGVPVGEGRWMRAEGDGSDDGLQVVEVTDGGSTVQPIKFRLLASPRGRRVPSIWGGFVNVPSDGAVGVTVRVSPSEPTGRLHLGGGRWFLRIGRGPLVWERLPENEISDEDLLRPVAAGPDGHFYLMRIRRRGVEILERPS